MDDRKVTREMLLLRQSYSLDQKISLSQAKIKEWYEHYDGMAYVAFSGGRDSTVLLHLVRSMYPWVPGVFSNTGLEYPEIVEFVKKQDNITVIRPEMNFRRVIEKYGYPVVSKQTALKIRKVRSNPDNAIANYYLTGYKKDGEYNRRGKISDKWMRLLDAPFSISEQCCDVMKKKPFKVYQRKSHRMPILGNMVYESDVRKWAYYKNGCIVTKKGAENCTPMAFWLEEDVTEYIKRNDIEVSTAYEHSDRTGCIFCAFGAHMEPYPNRFQRLKITHPKLWKYCMDKLGMREVLDYIGVPYEPSEVQLELMP